MRGPSVYKWGNTFVYRGERAIDKDTLQLPLQTHNFGNCSAASCHQTGFLHADLGADTSCDYSSTSSSICLRPSLLDIPKSAQG
jgi:hypothetical protein